MRILPTENGLFPNRHIPGLYFVREEYDLLLRKRREETDLPTLADDLTDWIFGTSNGHIGAIDSVLSTVKLYAKARRPTKMTLDSFLQEFNAPKDALEECAKEEAFHHGFPNRHTLQAPENGEAIDFVSDLLTSSSQTYPSEALPDGARRANQLGWVVVDGKSQTGTIRVEFPSLFHQSRISWLLNGSKAPNPNIDAMNLPEFVTAVVKAFSANALRHPERRITHGMPSIRETQWQNEVYSAACRVTGGRGIWLSPELAGRIDFYVLGNKGWRIEILRDGDRMEEHLRRFAAGGAYHSWIQKGTMKEYALLDFRSSTTARKKIPGCSIFHISFDRDFSHFSIQDCELNLIEEGIVLA
ncbi:hypothetical protein DFH09DRAFT_1177051 [Mycena vulgaris]|nr:hypothetical protein DFH09DRAFT_1177051 [Mycena vulgaris]